MTGAFRLALHAHRVEIAFIGCRSHACCERDSRSRGRWFERDRVKSAMIPRPRLRRAALPSARSRLPLTLRLQLHLLHQKAAQPSRLCCYSKEGMGATRDHGNVFGAIPGERVDLQVHARADKQENKASLVRVIPGSESPHRVEPPCKAFGKCGGCAFMHIAPAEQTALKEQQLQDHFRSNGVALPAALSPAVSGRSDLGYRRKARLGVRHTARHGTLLGFRERLYPGIAGTESCAVLHPRVGGAAVFSDLRATIDALSCKDQVPQVEASGERAYHAIACVLTTCLACCSGRQ